MTIAYHFVSDNLRNGRPVPEDNFKLVHEGPVKICNSGLHASLSAFDAMHYAPGNVICKVHCSGIVESHDDKFVCRERTILQRFDATELMVSFARECALSVIHLWDAPEIVIKYLKTGDPKLKDAARAAARAASRDAARAAAAAAAKKNQKAMFDSLVEQKFKEMLNED